MNKTHELTQLVNQGSLEGKVLFKPILMHFAARYIGSNYGLFASDYRVLAEANLRCLQDFDMDMMSLISDPYRETSAFGAGIEFIPHGVPRCLEEIVKTLEDVENLKIPDVYRSERTLDRIKAAELLSEKSQGNTPLIGWIEGPLAEACDLCGVSNMLMQLMMEPDFCIRLMDKCLQTAKDFAKAQIEAGCGIMGIGDAICSQIDTNTYDTFVKERHRELFDYVRSLGALVNLHICGDITHLLISLQELPIDILDLDHMVDLHQARSVMGPGVIMCGNINPVFVQDSTSGEVETASRQLITEHGPERYILSAGCEITVNTPPSNLHAMRKASLFI
jgi:MtaA/CmuA family methyltransferase